MRLTHERLSDLFCTAMLGNYRWSVEARDEKWSQALPEDEAAAALLGGDVVYVFDNDTESNSYGNLPSHMDEDGVIRYSMTLCDITVALEKIMDGDDCHLKKIVEEWTGPNGFHDVTGADELLQFIVFGKIIYG